MAKDVKYKIKAKDQTRSATERAKKNFMSVGATGVAVAKKIQKGFVRAGKASASAFKTGLLMSLTKISGAFKVALASATALGGALIIGGAKSRGTYEALQLRLEGVTGSAKEAEKTFKKIAKFAESTPFALEDLVRAQILLKAVGMQGDKALKQVADASAVMGSNVEDVAMAVASLESEPLKRLGIRLRTMGDEFTFTFRDRAGKEITKFAKGANEARKTLGDIFGMKFEGSVLKLSASLFGLLSTLKDVATASLAAFGQRFESPLKQLVRTLTEGIGKLADSPAMAKLASKVNSLFATANLLVKLSQGGFAGSTPEGQAVEGRAATDFLKAMVQDIMDYLLAVMEVAGARMGRAFFATLKGFSWKDIAMKIATFFAPRPSGAHLAKGKDEKMTQKELRLKNEENQKLREAGAFSRTRQFIEAGKAESNRFEMEEASKAKLDKELSEILANAMRTTQEDLLTKQGIGFLEQQRRNLHTTNIEKMVGKSARAEDGFGSRNRMLFRGFATREGFGSGDRFTSGIKGRLNTKSAGGSKLLSQFAQGVSTDAIFDGIHEGLSSVSVKAGESKAKPLFVQEVEPNNNGVN